MYYNTTHQRGDALKEAQIKAAKQTERVLFIFLKKYIENKVEKLTPSQIHDVYLRLYPDSPLTSIRRAINTLTKNGKLEMLSSKRIGRYGVEEHYWKIIEKPNL